LGLDFVKDDGLLYPDDEIFSAGENKLIPNFENEDDLPNLTDALTKRGFHEEEIVKVLGGNILRMLRAILKPRQSNLA
jgi:membrane dipeptidase